MPTVFSFCFRNTTGDVRLEGDRFAQQNNMDTAYYISSSTFVNGTKSLPMDRLLWPKISTDPTMNQFKAASKLGPEQVPLCRKIVASATCRSCANGTIEIEINAVAICQVQISSRSFWPFKLNSLIEMRFKRNCAFSCCSY